MHVPFVYVMMGVFMSAAVRDSSGSNVLVLCCAGGGQ